MAAAQGVRLVAALCLIAASLAAVLYFKPGQEAAAEFAISGVSADAVNRMQIEQPGKERIELTANGGKWRMSSPFAARADLGKVRNLLSLLDAKSSVRYSVSELARFDLEQPLFAITLNNQTIRFGAINPVSGEQYIASEDHVYLIPARHGAGLSGGAWASRKLLAEDEEPVRFEFPSFSAEKSGGEWKLTPPADALSQQDFTIWINRWRLAESIAATPANEPQGTPFKITLASGDEIPMLAMEKDGELLLVRQDENLRYQFSPAVAKPLLSPPVSPAAE